MAVVDASHQPCCEPQQQMPQQIVEITEEEFYYGQGVSQRPSAPSSSFTGGTALFSYSAMVANLDFTQPTDLLEYSDAAPQVPLGPLPELKPLVRLQHQHRQPIKPPPPMSLPAPGLTTEYNRRFLNNKASSRRRRRPPSSACSSCYRSPWVAPSGVIDRPPVRDVRLAMSCLLAVTVLCNMDHGSVPACLSNIAQDVTVNYVQQSLLGSTVYLGLIIGTLATAYSSGGGAIISPKSLLSLSIWGGALATTAYL